MTILHRWGNETFNASRLRQNYLLELVHKKWLEQHLKKYKVPIRLLAENVSSSENPAL